MGHSPRVIQPSSLRLHSHQHRCAPTIRCNAEKPKIVGMGSAGLDYLAVVEAFPHPDEKLRTLTSETQGGGNCGNALTAAARLGAAPTIVTKLGGDPLAQRIEEEFIDEGISVEAILHASPGTSSPFTYIIVDASGGTRTCIHTPLGEPLRPEEITDELLASVIKGARLIYFDGRLADAAIRLADAAKTAGIPILVEAERLREGIHELLERADYIVTSQNFPRDYTGLPTQGQAVSTMFEEFSNVQWMITTLGSRGSVLLERNEQTESVADGKIGDHLDALLEGMNNPAHHPEDDIVSYGCGNEPIYAGTLSDPGILYHLESGDTASVVLASAARLPSNYTVVDTTGAGDAFIGTLLFCIAIKLPVRRGMKAAAVVAARKCTGLGARPGLARTEDLDERLFLK